MIKWLSKITVSSKESDTFYNMYDNRVFPPHIVSKDVATKESIWMDPKYRIDDRNLQCVCWKPNHSTKIALSDTSFRLEGYAYTGAGRPVHRVEVSLDDGKSWRMATLNTFEEPTEFGMQWCWIFWHLDVPVSSLAGASEIVCRAWDDSQNSMPALPTWNLMGMMSHHWFRIKIQRVPGAEEIWFEHPTRVEPTAATVWPYDETMHLIDGEVASPGWAERMHKEYSLTYMPQAQDTESDPTSAWELQGAHKLKEMVTTDEVQGTVKELETITQASLEAHAAENWTAIHGLVYDVTDYLSEHPGGASIITALNGKDASDEFEEAGHTKLSRKEVDRLVVKGVLAGCEDLIARLRSVGWHEADGIPSVEQLSKAEKVLAKGNTGEGQVQPMESTLAATVRHVLLGSIGHVFGLLGSLFGPSTMRLMRQIGLAAALPPPVTLVDPTVKVKLALSSKVRLSRDTVRYTFALPSPQHVLGLPIGQHVALSTMMANPRTGGEPKYVSRLYTPTSADDDKGIVEFVIKTYYKDQHPKFPDGGWLSQYMDAMEIGDTLDIRGPSGKIIYKGKGVFSIRGKEKRYKHIGLVGGGTGITPCYQLMKYAALHSEPLSISLLSANPSKDDILLQSELNDLSAKGMKISYTIDRVKEGETWNGYVGFISEEMIKQSLPPPGDDTLVLACGPPMMLEKCVQPFCKNLGYSTVVEY